MAPNNKPPLIITINISSGWDLTLFENINGWLKKLSITWPIANPMATYIALAKITVLKSWVIWLDMVRRIIRIPPINGPIKGIKFNREHKNAITTAFGVPIIRRSIV